MAPIASSVHDKPVLGEKVTKQSPHIGVVVY
jgi:hypothetical protein